MKPKTKQADCPECRGKGFYSHFWICDYHDDLGDEVDYVELDDCLDCEWMEYACVGCGGTGKENEVEHHDS